MPYTDYTALRIELDDGVAAWVTIDHPPLNVLDATLITELNRLALALHHDDAVRVIVLQSADAEFFVAHGDMQFSTDPSSFTRVAETVSGDEALNPMQRLHERWHELPQVTIGKLAGLARGGGNELLLSLDMRFAALESSGQAQPEALLDIIPGGGGTQYLTRLVGRPRALEVILGAELYSAEVAERYGLINRALPAQELDRFVDTLARRIATLAPGVIAAAKAAVTAAALPLPLGLAEENRQLATLFFNPEASARARTLLEGGAQTREGERDLEELLNRSRQREVGPTRAG